MPARQRLNQELIEQMHILRNTLYGLRNPESGCHENIGVCVGDMCVGKEVSCFKGAGNNALPEHWKKRKSQYYLVIPLWVGRFDAILVIYMLYPLQCGGVGLVEQLNLRAILRVSYHSSVAEDLSRE